MQERFAIMNLIDLNHFKCEIKYYEISSGDISPQYVLDQQNIQKSWYVGLLVLVTGGSTDRFETSYQFQTFYGDISQVEFRKRLFLTYIFIFFYMIIFFGIMIPRMIWHTIYDDNVLKLAQPYKAFPIQSFLTTFFMHYFKNIPFLQF